MFSECVVLNSPQLLKDKQLLFIIGALLVLDALIISLWVAVDPMYSQITNFTAVVSLLYCPKTWKGERIQDFTQ